MIHKQHHRTLIDWLFDVTSKFGSKLYPFDIKGASFEAESLMINWTRKTTIITIIRTPNGSVSDSPRHPPGDFMDGGRGRSPLFFYISRSDMFLWRLKWWATVRHLLAALPLKRTLTSWRTVLFLLFSLMMSSGVWKTLSAHFFTHRFIEIDIVIDSSHIGL